MVNGNPHPLRQLRLDRHLTQQQIADRIGKPRTAVSAWESGRQGMTIENRALVARALGVAPTLLGPAYDAESPRPRRELTGSGRAVDTSNPNPHTAATDLLPSGNPPASQGDSLVADLPDHALFEKLSGLWRALEPDERLTVYNTAASLIGHSATSRTKAKNE